MNVTHIPYGEVRQLSRIDIAYATNDPALKPFLQHLPNMEGFRLALTERKKQEPNRRVLLQALHDQYDRLQLIPAVQHQLDALASSNTFTVTTAHQPCLFTGPLYYVYKIFSTINLCNQLNQQFPENHFVPVFVSGAEDHDFDEINKAHLFNKSIIWERQQYGAVGKMDTHTLIPALEELKSLLGESPHAQHLWSVINNAYTSQQEYGMATVQLLHDLFGPYGLVVLDMNVRALKALFVPVMEREILQQPSKALVEKTQLALQEAGFHGQAHAREINLFYLGDGFRERIVAQDDMFTVLNTSHSFTREQLLAELRQYPEKFSPNVVLRPLFQETILPNLAYVGGGGEIAYWLERKEQFRFFGVPFPVLIRRNSLLWIDEIGAKKIEKLGLSIEDLFQDTDALINRYVAAHTRHVISLTEEKEQLKDLFDKVLLKAKALDSNLEKTVLAEQTKHLNAFDVMEAKMLRTEKQQQETVVQQIRSLKEKYFPGNGLQERRDNFMPLYLKHGEKFMQFLHNNLDPLTSSFLVIQES